MRVVWIVGGPPESRPEIEKALAFDRTGLNYSVRECSSVEQIPSSHLVNAGVCVLIDALYGESRGFTGLRGLRGKQFRGPVFIFGEPASHDAAEAFANEGLTGFFPSFERADLYLVSGVVHSAIQYDGTLQISRYLAPGGRASSETIGSLKDFNAFSVKLAAFISRFGVDPASLKKVLMALSLPHIKTESGAPLIEHPFAIHYGMDPMKVILAATTFSRGATKEALLSAFAASVGALKSDKSAAGSMFPEIHHLPRATQNLLLVSGSSYMEDQLTVDPLTMLTTLAFPQKDKPSAATYFFGFTHVVPTPEMIEEEVVVATVERAPDSAADSINKQDLGSLLVDPPLVGDAPLQVSGVSASPSESYKGLLAGVANSTPHPAQVISEDPALASLSEQAVSERLREAMIEIDRLRQVGQAMSEDIKRLMSERRQPTTDRELRDSNVRLQSQQQQLTAEKLKALELVSTREKQIELMKEQFELIKKEKKLS